MIFRPVRCDYAAVACALLVGCSRSDAPHPAALSDSGGCIRCGAVGGGHVPGAAGSGGAGGGTGRGGGGNSNGMGNGGAATNVQTVQVLPSRVTELSFRTGDAYTGDVSITTFVGAGAASTSAVASGGIVTLPNLPVGPLLFDATPTNAQGFLGSLLRAEITTTMPQGVPIPLPIVDQSVIVTALTTLPVPQPFDPSMPRAHVVIFVTDANANPLSGVTLGSTLGGYVGYDLGDGYAGRATGVRGTIVILNVQRLASDAPSVTLTSPMLGQSISVPIALENGFVSFVHAAFAM